MSKSITGIFSLLLVAGMMGVYIPNALATLGEFPLETCTGNNALGQQGSSSAEQEKEQNQASAADGQAVVPEFNELNANNLNLGFQQNGECSPLFDDQPTFLEQAELENSTRIQ